ncbi:radical SAM protein [Thiocystis violacea]|uniref:radical SAM protein n=1 Tax=Thiocystis violacea TaxID=13725 RepID=UPI0019040C10|nr:radical SAM protein [Thiocystis violacea]MBK1721643.1 hypothetical protein [Thiocystis violacea]
MPICYVDLIDACHLKCQTCVRGTRVMPNTAVKMPLDYFERTVAKAKSEGYDVIGLYNWAEPFLNAKVADYVAIVKRSGLCCDISTTLSFAGREHLIEQVLAAGLDSMIVSISGFDQEVHAINHRGGDLRLVKANLERISALKRHGNIHTSVVLRFLKFDYNADEEARLRDYADTLGFQFQALQANGDPARPASALKVADAYRERLRGFTAARPYEQPGDICPLIADTIAIGANGQVTLCCGNPSFDFLDIGDYLDTSKEELLLTRFTHPMCASCTFPRRPATDADRAALTGALLARLGEPPGKRLPAQPEDSGLHEPDALAPVSAQPGRSFGDGALGRVLRRVIGRAP